MGKKEEKQDTSGYRLNNDMNNHVCSSAKPAELQTLTFGNLQRSTGTKLTGSINKTGGTISTYCGLTVVLMGTLLLLAI